jgi:chromosome segregation protein
LSDPDDVLSSGIEIYAQPPGKKLKNIALLSGGERSLTAVALLFATYMVKPSPFCILDEIDAALDESNVGTFVNLLTEFGKNSQFIIITHNKKTVTGAGTLLGVTMSEPGVSKIVSIRLGQTAREAVTES